MNCVFLLTNVTAVYYAILVVFDAYFYCIFAVLFHDLIITVVNFSAFSHLDSSSVPARLIRRERSSGI